MIATTPGPDRTRSPPERVSAAQVYARAALAAAATSRPSSWAQRLNWAATTPAAKRRAGRCCSSWTRGELLLCHLHYEKAASRIAEQNGTVLQAFDIFAPLSGWLPLLGKQRRRQTEPRFAAPAHDERPTAPCR